MSRKDYVAIAHVFRCAVERGGGEEQTASINHIVYEIGKVLMNDNPNFDFGKFARAIYGN